MVQRSLRCKSCNRILDDIYQDEMCIECLSEIEFAEEEGDFDECAFVCDDFFVGE